MNLKRVALILGLVLLTFVCFLVMDNKYDPLARYQYATKENRDVILEYMDQEDIDYIIQQKIKPEQFMNFITLEGFSAKNVLYYELCSQIQPTDLQYIVDFANKYRATIAYKDLENYLLNYTYGELEEFYSGAYIYVTNATLVPDPTSKDTILDDLRVVYKYVPKGMHTIDTSIIPSASKTKTEAIQIKEEVVVPLQGLCGALQEKTQVTCGGLILTSGYINYSDQIDLYEAALVKYGFDNFSHYEDYPGQSESQLGYTLTFTISQMNEEQILASEQVKWLQENASKYGFEIRYPKDEENKTGKYYQPLTLRYVGLSK